MFKLNFYNTMPNIKSFKFSAPILIIIFPSLFLSQLATCKMAGTCMKDGLWWVDKLQFSSYICCCCTQEKVNQDNQNDNEPWLKWVITIVGNCHFIMENSRVSTHENCKTYYIVVNIRALLSIPICFVLPCMKKTSDSNYT